METKRVEKTFSIFVVGFSDLSSCQIPLKSRLWSTCTRKFSKAWERKKLGSPGIWRGGFFRSVTAMVSSTVFTGPQKCDKCRIPPSYVHLVFALCHIQRGRRSTANSHPAHRLILPESQRLQKSQCVLKLDTSQGKKNTYILCIPLLKVETLVWYAPLTTTVATRWYINLKKSQQKTPKNTTLPACRIAVWPVKKTWKLLSLEKPKIPHISSQGNRLFTGGKGRQTEIPCIECVGMAKPYESQIEGSFRYWFST